MKNIYLLLSAFLLTFGWQASGQILNQSANWPNPAWSITGDYATTAIAFESNPTTTPNFAFDDDDAGSAHEDNIAAESPIIDLTAAHAGGETFIEATVQYGYRYLDADVLRFEYWDAAAATWVPWSATLPGNSTTVADNFCTIPKTTFVTPALNISSFTAAQLSGFRYRIYYNDSLAGPDFNYGFCFDSPVLKSLSCGAPSGLTVTGLTSTGANISWNAITGVDGFEYLLSTSAVAPASGTATTASTYTATGLTPLTTYYFHVRTDCASGFSTWNTISFTTGATPPSNDDCANAIVMSVNTDMTCAATSNGTTYGGTLSLAAAPCNGNPDDDVWYSFVASSVTHVVTLSNIVGLDGAGTDMYFQVLSGTCATPTSVLCSDPNVAYAYNLTVGATYLVRVYSYGTGRNTFTICVGTPGAPPANDEASAAVVLTVNPDLACAATTTGTTVNATPSADTAPSCSATGTNDDVWYTFTATSSVHRFVFSGVTGATMATALYTGTPGALTQVAGACATGTTLNFGSLVVGTVYYARVFTTSAVGTTTTPFTLCVGTPPAPPANDNCSGAVALTVNADVTCTTMTAGTTVDATLSMAATPCFGNPDDDVWYSFVAGSTSHNVSLQNIVPVVGTGSDMYFQVLSGVCGTQTSVLCSDPDSNILVGLSIGTTYYIRVYSYSGTARHNFNICVTTPPAAPANDNATGAVLLTVNPDLGCATTTNGTTISATPSTEAAPSCSATGINDDVWYSFVAPSTGNVRFEYSSVTTGTIATALYTGTPGSLTQVAGACMTGLVQDFVGLTSGTTYYARVYTTSSAAATTTNFTVCLGTLQTPVNDLCANATVLTPGGVFATNAQTGTNMAASTTATGLTFSCQPNRSLDVWYSVVVPASGNVTIETKPAAGSTLSDTVLSVFSGTCSTLTQVGCSDDDGDGAFSLVTVTGQTPGSTLLVGVWKFGATGNGDQFQVSAYDASLSATQFDSSSFTYYPNPVKDVLQLNYSQSIRSVSVYNVVGQQLIDTTVNASTGAVDMSKLSAGTYIVNVTTDNGSKTFKVVKI